jgi:hypothetical protein
VCVCVCAAGRQFRLIKEEEDRENKEEKRDLNTVKVHVFLELCII